MSKLINHFNILKPSFVEPEEHHFDNAENYIKTCVEAKVTQVCDAFEKEHRQELALVADTTVFLSGKLLGKPKSSREATAMLQHLSGKTHQVYTGYWLGMIQAASFQPAQIQWEISEVKFRQLSPALISKYVRSQEPMDKAGAYGFQGLGLELVKSVEGSYSNIMGLPILKIETELKKMEAALSSVGARWKSFQDSVAAALKQAGRDAKTLQILPVSKTRSAEELRPWLRLEDFPQRLGENYGSELLEKAQTLAKEFPALRWDFIGPLQSRKIEELCSVATCLQTVSREKELEVLKKLQARGVALPDLLVQINVSGETQKNGIAMGEHEQFFKKIEALGLKNQIKGLMCLPASVEEIGERELRAQFCKLREMRDQILPNGILSMGMSGDYQIAIDEGSNLIRVGSLLFGERA